MAIVIDKRMKNKIESMYLYDKGVCSVRFTDIEETFWFDSEGGLQEFLHHIARERYYDKALRKGWFPYINEQGNTIHYYVENERGKLTITQEILR